MLVHLISKRSELPLFLIITVMLSALLIGSIPSDAQIQFTITEINPDQSSLDQTDPDGASGGRVNNIAAAADGSAFYAASEWGGLWKSIDQGRRWFRLNNLSCVAVWDVEVDPSNPNKVYSTCFYDGRVNSLAGINVSTDGGASWTHPATAIPPAGTYTTAARRDEPSAFGISIDPDNSQNVFIGTNAGLAISNDGGVTWRYVDPTPGDTADNVWDVVVHDEGIIDTVGDDGHQRSTDGGTTWTTAAGAPLASGIASIAVSPDESYVLFATVGDQIFESDDGGATWPTIITNPSIQGRIPFLATNQRTGRNFDLWFGDFTLSRATCTTPANPAPGGAARCPINTWTGAFTRGSGGHDDSSDILFAPGVGNNACPVLFSSDGGVYFNTLNTSPNCHSPAWEQPTQTPHSLWVFGMGGADQSGTTNEDLYFGNQDNGTFAASDAGAVNPTWNNRDCCDGFDASAEPVRVLYSVCCGPGRANRLFLRNQVMIGGGEINTYPQDGLVPGFKFIDAVARFGDSQYVVVTNNCNTFPNNIDDDNDGQIDEINETRGCSGVNAGDGGVFTTTDITANPIVWTELGSGSEPNSSNIAGVKVAVSNDTPTFYVLVGQGNGFTRDLLFRFEGTDPAGIWEQVNPPGGVGGFGIFDVDPRNPDRIFASHLRQGSDPQMIFTTDGGTNWNNLPSLDLMMTGAGVFRYQNFRGPTNFTGFNGYPQPTLIAIDPSNSNLLVAGAADAGIFISLNGGTTWTLVTDPINPFCVTRKPHIPRPRFAYFDHEPFGIFTQTTNIYIGTQGRGVWRISFEQRRRLLDICDLNPLRCLTPLLEKGALVLECVDSPECVVVDDLPKNCLVKFDCPGCEGFEMCPPFYNMYFDELDPEIWEIGLFTEKGEPVDHQIFKTEKGVVLSFRPSKELFKEGSIGDYKIGFALKPNGKPLRYKVPTRLEVSDQPYIPKKDEK